MKERPILFNGEMVRAILDGRKTQTRRVVKPQPHAVQQFGQTMWECDGGGMAGQFSDHIFGSCFAQLVKCPFGRVGDRLWARETCAWLGDESYHTIHYKADRDDWPKKNCGWVPSIHMPRWASRITLEITGVRVERLQEISAFDAHQEGIGPVILSEVYPYGMKTRGAIEQFKHLWESTGGDWSANPWVWVISFKRVRA